MAAIHNLTDLELRNWIRSGKPRARSDGGGLTFCLSRAGHASFVLRYRLNGKQREITIGDYPAVTLERARTLAAELRGKVAEGLDVAREKQQKKQQSTRPTTFGELADDYLARCAANLKDSSRKEIRRCLDKDVMPRIGKIPLSALEPADIVILTESIAKRSHSVARRIYEMVSVICGHGVAKCLLRTNPCTDLRVSSIIGTRPARQRLKLERRELVAFLAALPRLGRENELAIRILLATGTRKSELIKARWHDLDPAAETWRIPAEHAKNGRAFTIPLPPIVCRWFDELRGLAGGSPWVLPARGLRRSSAAGHINISTLNAAMKRLAGIQREPTPHDLRSTARSYFAELGVPIVVAERCLNHAIGGLVERYDKHDYLAERRKALELWAAFIESAEQSTPWNVRPIKASAR